MPEFHLTVFDIVVIGLYFGFVALVGWAVSRNVKSGEDLFLAGRSLGFAAIGFSLFASNLSSTTLLGVTGQAYATGISVVNYEIMAGLLLAVMAVTTIPRFLRLRITTAPEYLGIRFGPASQKYFSALSIFLTVFVDMAASVYAGVLVLQTFFPSAPFLPVCFGIAIFAGLYTAAGGLRAVVYTDVLQAIVLLIGSATITFYVFQAVGFSWGTAVAQLPEGHLSLVRPADDPTLPWLGLVIGVPILGFYYWSTNQYILQRVFGARDLKAAQRGAVLAGFLKLTPLFLMGIPGAMALRLLPELPNPDMVYPTLILTYLPAGFAGLVIAGLIAAIMSTVDSTLNSASTLILHDFIDVKKRGWTNETYLRVGRLLTAGLIVIAAAWPLVIREFPGVFTYIQQVFGYAVPPVVAVFILGMAWRRASGRGALLTLITGHIIGLITFAWRSYALSHGLNDGLPHFTIVAGVTTAICFLLCIAFSLVFPDTASGTIARSDGAKDDASADGDGGGARVLWSVIALLIVTCLLYIVFW